MEWIAKVIEIIKLPTKFIVAIFLFCSVLTFSSDSFLESIGFSSFKEDYKIYISLGFLVSAILLTIELFSVIQRKRKLKKMIGKQRERIDRRLMTLDSSEKGVLREFYLQGQNTIKLPMDHPVVAGLLSAGILTQVGHHGRMSLAGMLISMRIADYARQNITLDKIDLPYGEPTNQEMDFLRNNRPDFMSQIMREDSLFRF